MVNGVRDIERLLGVNPQGGWRVKFAGAFADVPHLGEIASGAIEDLHSAIAGIGHINVPLVVGGDAPGTVELGGAAPGFTDFPEILAIAGKDLDAMILGISDDYPSFSI